MDKTKLRELMKADLLKNTDRICFFNSMKAWGGGEKWHFDMAGRMHNRSYKVLVITSKHSELKKRLNNSEIPIRTFRISNLSFLNPVKILRVAGALKRNHVGTIIINLSADLKVAGIASVLAGVNRVIYRRGSAIPVKNTILNRLIFRYIIDDVIANSEETKATILSKNPSLFNADKIKVIYNGINLDLYDSSEPDRVFNKESNEVIIGNAGRLVRQKGQQYLIEIASILKSRGIKFKMLIAGEGRLQNDLFNMVQERNLGAEVVFIGFVENISSFMESIDIFVLTSLWEGFGYVLVEAMACEKPVVAFKISSNPEIVEDKTTGYLIEPFDVEAFSDKLSLLISDPVLRHSIGKQGRKRVEELFTIEKTADNLEKMLNE